MKLWNSYAFFCNYARIDNFDPAQPQVAVKDRPDIDRWILSDLQLLIQTARKAFEDYNIMAFCLAAETFVDDKLSNWYVRRNRRRFWKSEQGTDKLAAYQTLYTVLLTLTKLCAPVIPFVTERLYQNLRTDGLPLSVHLTDYPTPDESLIDAQLSADMEALLRLVSLGSATRNQVKIKVRQRLAELKIQSGHESDRRAGERFADQICEELNLKKVTLHDPSSGPLLNFTIKPNPKNLGPKLGGKLKEVQAFVSTHAPILLKAFQSGQSYELPLPDSAVILEPTDFFIQPDVPQGFAGLADKGTQLLLDARITPELAREGMAREVIRYVQQARKDSGLEMEDRIILYLATESEELQRAIDEHRSYIASETLTIEWSMEPLGEGAYKTQVTIDGNSLTIELRKA